MVLNLAILCVIVVAVVVFPLTYVAGPLTEGARELVISVGIFVAIFATMCSLYGWKVVLLVQGYDYDVLLQLSKKKLRGTVYATGQSDLAKVGDDSKIDSLLELPLTPLGEKKFGASNKNPFDAVKTKNLLNRREVCREQLTHWSGTLRHTEAMMLMQADNESTAAGRADQTNVSQSPKG